MGRAISFKPQFDGLRFLLKRSLQGPLRCKSPALQITAHRPYRQVNEKALFELSHYCLGIPIRKTEFHLIRALIHNVLTDSMCLRRRQNTNLPHETRSIALPGTSPVSHLANPDHNGPSADSKGLINRYLGLTSAMHSNGNLAELLSRSRFQFAVHTSRA